MKKYTAYPNNIARSVNLVLGRKAVHKGKSFVVTIEHPRNEEFLAELDIFKFPKNKEQKRELVNKLFSQNSYKVGGYKTNPTKFAKKALVQIDTSKYVQTGRFKYLEEMPQKQPAPTV